ncbi:hypothetical protein [Blautia wexlerae]|nr:hypothetical protein [Blautia wexlerae]NSF65181.1 hypothetical protein [Blautia wexlerae]
MKEKIKTYKVERVFLAKCSISEFVSRIVAAHVNGSSGAFSHKSTGKE